MSPSCTASAEIVVTPSLRTIPSRRRFVVFGAGVSGGLRPGLKVGQGPRHGDLATGVGAGHGSPSGTPPPHPTAGHLPTETRAQGRRDVDIYVRDMRSTGPTLFQTRSSTVGTPLALCRGFADNTHRSLIPGAKSTLSSPWTSPMAVCAPGILEPKRCSYTTGGGVQVPTRLNRFLKIQTKACWGGVRI